MRYALIEDGIVTRLIWLYEGNASDFPDAVSIDDRPVCVGDSYVGGKFYRDGEEVLTEMEVLEKEAADMRAALELLGVSE